MHKRSFSAPFVFDNKMLQLSQIVKCGTLNFKYNFSKLQNLIFLNDNPKIPSLYHLKYYKIISDTVFFSYSFLQVPFYFSIISLYIILYAQK